MRQSIDRAIFIVERIIQNLESANAAASGAELLSIHEFAKAATLACQWAIEFKGFANYVQSESEENSGWINQEYYEVICNNPLLGFNLFNSFTEIEKWLEGKAKYPLTEIQEKLKECLNEVNKLQDHLLIYEYELKD